MGERSGEISRLKKEFRRLETKVLILIAIPLPVFSIVYLSVSQGSSFILPTVPAILNPVLLFLVIALLVAQILRFNGRIQGIRNSDRELIQRVGLLGKATMERFWVLFWVGLLASLGLLLYENPGFTIAYAITLVFVSLGKPTPHRIIQQLKLNKEEREKVQQINLRDP
jgi:hypothetical protein